MLQVGFIATYFSSHLLLHSSWALLAWLASLINSSGIIFQHFLPNYFKIIYKHNWTQLMVLINRSESCREYIIKGTKYNKCPQWSSSSESQSYIYPSFLFYFFIPTSSLKQQGLLLFCSCFLMPVQTKTSSATEVVHSVHVSTIFRSQLSKSGLCLLALPFSWWWLSSEGVWLFVLVPDSSGNFWPSANTCRIVMLIREDCKYLAQTCQSSSELCSITEPTGRSEESAWSRHEGKAVPSGLGRTRGTAWYSRRLKPDITMISPLCMNIAVGASSRFRPPSKNIEDCPKLKMV